MARILILTLLALALLAHGQIPVDPLVGMPGGLRGSRDIPGLSFAGLAGLWIPGGCPGELNPQCRWWHAGWNLLLQSEDLTTTWSPFGSPVTTATTVEDDDGAATEGLHQTVAAPDGTTRTWPLWVLKDAIVPATRFPAFRVTVSAAYWVYFDTQSGATNVSAGLGGSHTVTSETIGGNDYWKLAITVTTDDANGIQVTVYPAAGANANLTTTSTAAVGTITVLRQQLNTGAVAQPYQKTTDKQKLVNWASPGTNDGCLGSNCSGADTNDPTETTLSRNLLAPGSTEDLTTTWAVVGSPVVTTTTVEDDAGAAHEYVSQTIAAPDGTTYTRIIWVLKDAVAPATRFPRFRNLVGGSYNVHLDTQSGATTEAAGLSGSHTVTAEQIGGTDYWRVEITFTTDDASGIFMDVDPAFGANADLTTGAVAAVGTITVLRQQLEFGSAATTYVNPATGRRVVADFAVDDQATVASFAALSGNTAYGFIIVFKQDDPAGAAQTLLYHTNGGFVVYIAAGTRNIHFKSGGGDWDTGLDTTPGQWQVLTLAWDGESRLKWAYLDGANEQTTTAGADNTLGSVTLYIGRWSNGTLPFDGNIALAAVYSRALGAAEVGRATTDIARKQCSEFGRLCDVASRSWPAYGWLGLPAMPWVLADMHPLTWADERIRATYDVIAEVNQ